MNGNSDKHKPLSPEELFRLLETKNEGTLSGEGLDDFEKEALDGFSAHTSAEKARQLTADLHTRIHEKLREPEKKRPVARGIWLGAAASIILGLIISAYVLVQEAKDSEDLALNKEVPEKMKDMATAPVAKAPETNTIADEGQNKQPVPQTPAGDAMVSQSTVEEPMAISENIPPHTPYSKKEEDVNRSKDGELADGLKTSKDASRKSQAQATTGYDTKFTEISAMQDDQKVDFVTNGTVAANKANAPAKGDLANSTPPTEKAEKESSVVTFESVEPVNEKKEKQSLLLRKKKPLTKDTDKNAGPTTAGSTKTEEKKAQEERVSPGYYSGSDYYTGGEQALKAGISAWFKEHGYNAPKGTYRIRVSIKTDRTSEVLELKAEKDQDHETVRLLEKCLETLKGWNPGIIGQGAAGNEAVFILNF